VLANLYHSRQLYNTLIRPSHESPAVGLQTCTCISRLSGPVELTLRYTTPDIHCIDVGGTSATMELSSVQYVKKLKLLCYLLQFSGPLKL